MIKNMSQSRLCYVLGVVLSSGLAGCGGAPSGGEIHAALKKQIEEDQAQIRRVGGPAAGMLKAMTPEVVDARKIGCKEDGEKAYRCDVELELKQSGSVQKTSVSLRMVKTSEGWMAGR